VAALPARESYQLRSGALDHVRILQDVVIAVNRKDLHCELLASQGENAHKRLHGYVRIHFNEDSKLRRHGPILARPRRRSIRGYLYTVSWLA
jgi:hypothetical protein